MGLRTAWAARLGGFGMALLPLLSPAVHAQGITWPEAQVLPRFAAFTTLDVADISGLTFDRKVSLSVLQGLVNRNRPRIYLLDAQQAGEGKNFWLDRMMSVKNSIADPLSLFAKYRSEVTGVCIYDPAVPATINVAVTAAGATGCVAASPAFAQALAAAPYSLPATLDLRTRAFADDRAAYAWARAEYWPRCSRRMLGGMRPGVHYPLYDQLVANRAMAVWLAPEDAGDRPHLDALFQDMEANGVYLGWWPGETSGVGYASGYGVITFATDWFANATVHAGVPAVQAGLPEVAAPPARTNRCHIALVMSDGDNLQIQQHLFPNRWKSPVRGTFPVSWTQAPALADAAPAILNYYYATRTPNDCFITGPSGAGYVLPEKMKGPDLRGFARLTEAYLRKSGIRTATVWGNAAAPSDTFGLHCPSLLGMANHQHDEPLAPRGSRRWAGGMVSVDMTPDYASFAHQAIREVDEKRAAWDRKGPLYLAVQLNANVANLEELKKVYDHYKDTAEVAFVRADQLFQLMRAGNPTGAIRGARLAAPGRVTLQVRQGAVWFDGAGLPILATGRAYPGTARLTPSP